MMMRATNLCALLATLAASSIARAEPSIRAAAGTVTRGQTLTLSGSGFGTRADFNDIGDEWSGDHYLAFRFKDFEDGDLESDGFYPQKSDSPWSPSTEELAILDGGPPGSSKYLRRAYKNGEVGGLSADFHGAGDQLYTSLKFMMPPDTQSGKLWRMWADAPQNDIFLSSGCNNYSLRGASSCGAPSCAGAETEWGEGPELNAGTWHRVEVWADATTGTFSTWIDGKLAWSKDNWLATSLSLDGHTIDFPNMIDDETRDPDCPPLGSYNYDDIYVDFTQARVELGDMPTWSASTLKELQIPTSWADGSVEVRVSTGPFTDGQTVYAYVVADDGSVNEMGFPITISGTTSSTSSASVTASGATVGGGEGAGSGVGSGAAGSGGGSPSDEAEGSGCSYVARQPERSGWLGAGVLFAIAALSNRRRRRSGAVVLGAVASCLALACDDGGSSNGEGGSGAGETTSSAPNGPATSGTQSTGSTGSQSTSTETTTGSTGGGPGGTITIRGSGFGTKPSAAPILYDDFEAGAVGSKIENQAAVVGSWESGAGSTVPEYSDANVRTGARSSLHAFDAVDYNASLAKNVELTTLYLDYWTYVEPLDPLPNGFSRNFKPFRFYGAGDMLQTGITTLSGNSAAITYFDDLESGIGVTEWSDGYPVGTWFHIQTWVRLNDVGQANGTVMSRVDGDLNGVTGAELRGQNEPLGQLRIGHYWATDPVAEWPYEISGANVYVDDVYFDATWQRVEVGDADTYDAVQHREIQLVTSWSDTEVTFQLSKGTLPSGPAWAFVIGEDGTVLATEAITLP